MDSMLQANAPPNNYSAEISMLVSPLLHQSASESNLLGNKEIIDDVEHRLMESLLGCGSADLEM